MCMREIFDKNNYVLVLGVIQNNIDFCYNIHIIWYITNKNI